VNELTSSILKLLILISFASPRLFADDDEQLKAGQDAFQKGDYPAAIKALKDAIKSNKKDVQSYILLGRTYLMIDSMDLATATLVQARELDTANVTIYLLMGDSYAKQSIWAASVEHYKKAAELAPSYIEAHTKTGHSYKMMRKYKEAVASYTQVLALDSNNVGALHEMSSIYARAKQYANVLPYAKRVSELKPDSLMFLLEYEKALNETKRSVELIPVAKTILARDASQSDVEAHLAAAYMATGQIFKVVESYAHLNADSLPMADLLRYAKALKAIDSLVMSEKIFLKAVKKDSSKCEIYYDFGTLLMKLKKYGEAIKAFEHKIACDTSAGYQFASHLNMAMSMMQLKRFNDATPHIQRSIDLRPDNIQAWVSMAQNLGQLEKTNEEITAYKKVIEIGTSDVNEGKFTTQVCEAYRMIGVRLLIDAVEASKGGEPKKEKYSASLEYLKKALPCNPKDCQMLLWIGQANQNANNKDEAKKYYHKVIDSCPKAKEADTAKEALKALGEETQ